MLQMTDIISARSTTLWTEVDGSLVVLDVDSGRYFNLENVSFDIWKNIASPIAISDLCDRLIAAYDAPEERIRRSVLVFLEKLLDHSLITVA